MDGTGESPARRRTLLGDTERERLAHLLREHYAAGRLSLEELRRRVEMVFGAAYLDEAEAALAELPPVAAGASSGGNAGEGQRRGWLRRRGHAQAARPEPGWQQTAERFRDPTSGVVMRVWVNPADGSRHYVPDSAATAG
ncbi:MAG TPA: DUF1707 domain-containing protein [Trebonia sp.]